MSKKQTRRSVSMNRAVYESVKNAAHSQGVTMAELVESALRAYGIAAPAVERQTPRAVESMQVARGYVIAATPVRRPSPERRMLGDGIANALGFE